MGFAEALVIYYNKKSRNLLRLGTLYNGNDDNAEEEQPVEGDIVDEDGASDQPQQISFSTISGTTGHHFDDEMGDDTI